MMAPLNNTNIIDTKDEGIVVKDTLISISDEKLRSCTNNQKCGIMWL